MKTPSPQLASPASDIYSFLNSRIKERDCLLGRCYTSSDRRTPRENNITRISRTEQGRSRKSRNTVHVESSRKFLSTA